MAKDRFESSAADRAAVARALGPDRSMLVSAPRFDSDVFLNVPFDAAYEPLFVALIAGVVGMRRRPRCVLEIPEGGGGRVARILDLMGRCSASVHDLSRVTLSGPRGKRVPRFNMPFELGLACGLAHLTNRHSYVVMEAEPYRAQRSLSDLGGNDPYVHRGTPQGVLSVVSDWLGSRAHDPSPRKLARLHEIVAERASELKSDAGADSMFTPALFRRTTLVAAAVAKNMQLTP